MKTYKGKRTAGNKGKKEGKKEVLQVVDDRKVGKRRAAQETNKSSKKVAMKDPNKPKRPPSAFFVFLEEFRKIFKQEHPNVKAVSAVGKAGGEKWKSLSGAEKAPYEAKAAKRKSEYERLMTAYNKKQESMGDDDNEDDDVESERSKSEINGEDDEGDMEEEEEDSEDDD